MSNARSEKLAVTCADGSVIRFEDTPERVYYLDGGKICSAVIEGMAHENPWSRSVVAIVNKVCMHGHQLYRSEAAAIRELLKNPKSTILNAQLEKALGDEEELRRRLDELENQCNKSTAESSGNPPSPSTPAGSPEAS